MIRRMTLAAAAALAISASAAQAQSADDAFGTWRNPDNGSHVQMYKCGEALCAKIVKSGDGQKTDDKNPDPAKKSRPIEGLVIMSGATKSSDKEWKGQLYNRVDGGTYSGTITVKSKSAIDLSGCTAAIFCKTVTWARVN